jgi:hypothetical protein
MGTTLEYWALHGLTSWSHGAGQATPSRSVSEYLRLGDFGIIWSLSEWNKNPGLDFEVTRCFVWPAM